MSNNANNNMPSFCKKCGFKLPEYATFCPKCGTKREPIPDRAANSSSKKAPIDIDTIQTFDQFLNYYRKER